MTLKRTATTTGEEFKDEWSDYDRLLKGTSTVNGVFQENTYDTGGIWHGNGAAATEEPIGHITTASYQYDEWGGRFYDSWTGSVESSEGCVGGIQISDDIADSGMFSVGHRNCAAGVLGRFISRDPIGHAGNLNLYAYPTNPVKYVDPSGLDEEEANCTVTISARGPKNWLALLPKKQGHVWLEARRPDGSGFNAGGYPEGVTYEGLTTEGFFVTGSYGRKKFSINAEAGAEASRTFHITESQLEELAAYMNGELDQKPYNLYDNNCVHTSVNGLEHIGIDFDIANLFGVLSPKDAVWQIRHPPRTQERRPEDFPNVYGRTRGILGSPQPHREPARGSRSGWLRSRGQK